MALSGSARRREVKLDEFALPARFEHAAPRAEASYVLRRQVPLLPGDMSVRERGMASDIDFDGDVNQRRPKLPSVRRTRKAAFETFIARDRLHPIRLARLVEHAHAGRVPGERGVGEGIDPEDALAHGPQRSALSVNGPGAGLWIVAPVTGRFPGASHRPETPRGKTAIHRIALHTFITGSMPSASIAAGAWHQSSLSLLRCPPLLCDPPGFGELSRESGTGQLVPL